MFVQGDRIVYPGHGVACVTRIIKKMVGGIEVDFYELTFTRGAIILVPTNNASALRPLSSGIKLRMCLFYCRSRSSVLTRMN